MPLKYQGNEVLAFEVYLNHAGKYRGEKMEYRWCVKTVRRDGQDGFVYLADTKEFETPQEAFADMLKHCDNIEDG